MNSHYNSWDKQERLTKLVLKKLRRMKQEVNVCNALIWLMTTPVLLSTC
jgi:hypothetical protein